MMRRALFVGVDKYADPTIRDLNYPSEDATELASVFWRLLKFDCVEKLVNPSHAPEVVDAIRGITRGLGPGDLFLFFFAGHGFRVKENHVLVCAKDEFADLEDAYAGLPVGQLKKRMRGPWNRMLVLDACQNDIRKTRGADCGVALRDLELIHGSEAGAPDAGLQVVITSCSEGQKALEVSDLGHGLFTSAFLDSVTAFADSRRRMDLKVLRTDLGVRMGRLINKYQLRDKQVPMFTMPTDAGSIVLFNGDGPAVSQQPTIVPHVVTSAPSLVVCPVCFGNVRIEGTHNCAKCGSKYVCADCWDKEYRCCAEQCGISAIIRTIVVAVAAILTPIVLLIVTGISIPVVTSLSIAVFSALAISVAGIPLIVLIAGAAAISIAIYGVERAKADFIRNVKGYDLPQWARDLISDDKISKILSEQRKSVNYKIESKVREDRNFVSSIRDSLGGAIAERYLILARDLALRITE